MGANPIASNTATTLLRPTHGTRFRVSFTTIHILNQRHSSIFQNVSDPTGMLMKHRTPKLLAAAFAKETCLPAPSGTFGCSCASTVSSKNIEYQNDEQNSRMMRRVSFQLLSLQHDPPFIRRHKTTKSPSSRPIQKSKLYKVLVAETQKRTERQAAAECSKRSSSPGTIHRP